MKKYIIAALLLLLAPLCMKAQTVFQPLAFGADGFHSNNWYYDYVGLRLTVLTPSSVAGEKIYTISNDGSGISGAWGAAVTTPIVNKQIVMPQAGDSLCTVPVTVSMTGKVALVYRGSNEYVCKALAVQAAGAIACIIVNNVPGAGPSGMGSGTTCSSSGVLIPVLMISKEDGDALDALYCSGTIPTVSMSRWGQNFQNDLGFVPQGITGWSNFATPSNQMDGGSPYAAYKGLDGAFIANYGLHKATNVKINSSLSYTPTGGSPTVVHAATTPNLANFLAADSIYAMFDAAEYNLPSTATGTGRFDLDYTIVSDSTDQFSADNTARYTFYKSDSVYSKGRYDFVDNEPVASSNRGPSGFFTYMWGPMYYVAHGGTCLTSVQFSLFSNTTGSLIDAGLFAVEVHAYKWQNGTVLADSFMQNGELTEIAMGTYFIQPSDSSGTVLKAHMGSASGVPGGVMLDSNSWYYVAVEVPAGFFLGVDGRQSPFPRILGRAYASNTLDYSNVFWPGDHSTLTSSSFTSQYQAPCAFSGTYYVNSLDSFNYKDLKGLIPAVSMIVNNNPISLISGPTGLCIGSSTFFTDPVLGGTWTSSAPAVASIDLTTGIATPLSPGTAVITYHAASATATITVTVAPFPNAGAIGGPFNICTGSSITLSETATGGIWGVGDPAYLSITSAGVITGIAPGFTYAKYVVANACGADSAMHSISVGPAPAVGTISGPDAVCVGASITLSETVTGGMWSSASSNASVAGATVSGISAGTATISYAITASCGIAAATATITVNPAPAPVIVQSGVDLSTSIPYASYQWLFSGSAIGGATSATYTATLNGPYAVTVTDANGCSGTSELALVSSVGVQNVGLPNSELSLTPNPTAGTFMIRTAGAGILTVISADGREIKSYKVDSGNTMLELPGLLTPGIYTCRFQGDNGSKANIKLVYAPR